MSDLVSFVSRVMAAGASGLWALAGVSLAALDEDALARYAAGDYDAAVIAAEMAGGPDNLALAARALNAVAYFDDGRKSTRKIAGGALEYAEAALAIEPDHPEGHLQAAISLSLRSAKMSPVRALLMDLPVRARKHIDRALESSPDNVWALSTSGAWRVEVARRGGGALFGADPELGYEELRKARAGAPDNVAIAYEAALRLLASRREEWRPTAIEALEVAVAEAPDTQFEADLQAKARELQAAVEAGPDAVREFVNAQP